MTATLTADAATGIRIIESDDRVIHFVPKGVDPIPGVEAVRAAAEDSKTLGFDVETTAGWLSDRTYNYMTSMQIGTSTVALLLDPWDKRHRAAMTDLMTDPQYTLTAHNASFDTLLLVQRGIVPSVSSVYERLKDTMVYARLLGAGEFATTSEKRESQFSVGLKQLTRGLCGDHATSADAKKALIALQKTMRTKGVSDTPNALFKPYAAVVVDREGNVTGDLRTGNSWALFERDADAFIRYCAADVFDVVQLLGRIAPPIEALFPERLAAEHRIDRLVAEMANRGVGFDRARAVEILKEKYAIIDAAADELGALGVDVTPKNQQVRGDDGRVHTLSREEIVAAAIRKEGIDVPLKLDGNGSWKPELDKQSLKKYARAGSAVAPHFRTWRKANKEIQTYLAPYLKVRADRIHADINAGAASSGRMSANSPNVQNVPEDVKPCFVADPGMVFISADFSSIEMRVAAAVTGDPELVRMYTDELPSDATDAQRKERDPYWLTAWNVWGTEATEAQRKLAKIIVLGSMYGGGAPKLASGADIPVGEAQRILKGYERTFPQLKQWWKDNMNDRIYSGRSFWTLETGRFQAIDPARAWAGFNRMIQGTARDLLLDAMFRLEDAGLAEHMLLPIHDEVLFQVPAEDADAFIPRILAAMETVFLGVPITAEAKVLGERWTEKTSVKKPAAPTT